MDFQDKNCSFSPRTDLAAECCELLSESGQGDIDGIESTEEIFSGIKVERIKIKTEDGAVKLGKPRGTYITVDAGKLWQYSGEEFEALCDICAAELSSLIPKSGSCLLVCLGNRNITADSQGPLCAESFVVSRHIKQHSPELFSQLSLRESACIVPDVLGNTGVEAADTVRGIAEKIMPDFIVAADSLASRRTERLGTTLQMSDTGISPGSGVGNHRTALNKGTLGVPVIAIGVPTVVDAATVGADVLEEYFRSAGETLDDKTREQILTEVLKRGSFNYFVTPKNSDIISKCAANLIAMSLNKALNPHISYTEFRELCNNS